VDESKFNPTKLGRRRKVGPRGAEHVVVDHRPYEPRLNMILMTTLERRDDWLFFDLKQGTNNAQSFLNFLDLAARNGRIPPGSFVVWDNARIHDGNDIVDAVDAILARCGALRVNLPTYSPEFNVCELVFAEIKCFLRNNPRIGWDLMRRVLEGAASVTWQNLLAYYEHCTSVALRVF